MIPLLYLLGICLLATSLGSKVFSLLRLGVSDFTEKLVFCAALGLGALSYIVFALGITGLANGYALYGIFAFLALLCRHEIVFIVHGMAGAKLRLGHSLEYLLIFVVGLAILLNFIGTLAPVSSADALFYHMEAPRQYSQQRRIVEMPWEWRTFQPFNIEMLYLLGMLLWNDVLGALFHFSSGVLVAIALIALCGRHFPSAHPILAAAIFYVSGLIALESTSGFIELGLALFVLLSIFAFFNWIVEARDRLLLVSGIFGGLAAGAKLNGVVLPAILLLILVGDMVFKHAFRFRALLVFIAPIVALMAPWYLRNYFWTGNLVYPFFSDLIGRQDTLATYALNPASTYGYGQDLAALILAPFNLTFRGAAFDKGQLIGPIYLA